MPECASFKKSTKSFSCKLSFRASLKSFLNTTTASDLNNSLKRWCLQQETPISTRIPCCKKKCHTWFWWYHCKACVFILTDETTWLGFPDLFKRQNNYIIFLFIHSGLYICRNCTFIAFVISRETRLTPFFPCLVFFFPTFTKFTPCLRKWHNTNIYTAYITWSYQCFSKSKNLDTNCRCIPHVFCWVLACME